MTTKIPAAGYLRMSSDKQDKSIDSQRDEVVAYAAHHGYRIVKWYCDEGISGWKSKQRHSFLSLIADAAGGEFKVILCWDQGRFSRFDPMEANFYWHQLRQADVTIETVREGKLDFESLGGWLTASIAQHGKSEYVKSLAADVVRGRRRQILAGNWISCPPYGYKLNSTTGRLELGDVQEIEVVRRIFQMRVKGLGRRAIAMALNKERIPSRRSAAWHPTQIAAMLGRQTYIGNTVIGQQQTGKFAHITEELQTFEGTHPPIIDLELWKAVQRRMRPTGTSVVKRRGEGAHLSGLLYCGRCGHVMYADRRDEKYICSHYHSYGLCSHNTISYRTALQAVADKIRSVFLLGSVEKLTAAIEKVLAKRKASKSQVDATAIKRQIAEIDRKLEGAADRLLEVEPSLVKDVRAAMLAMKEKRLALAERLATETAEKRRPRTAKQIAQQLWELDRVLKQGDTATVQAALAERIERVVIQFEGKPTVRNPARIRWLASGGTLFFLCPEGTTFSRPILPLPSSRRAKNSCGAASRLPSLFPKKVMAGETPVPRIHALRMNSAA